MKILTLILNTNNKVTDGQWWLDMQAEYQHKFLNDLEKIINEQE